MNHKSISNHEEHEEHEEKNNNHEYLLFDLLRALRVFRGEFFAVLFVRIESDMICTTIKGEFNAAGFACAAALRPMLAGDAGRWAEQELASCSRRNAPNPSKNQMKLEIWNLKLDEGIPLLF